MQSNPWQSPLPDLTSSEFVMAPRNYQPRHEGPVSARVHGWFANRHRRGNATGRNGDITGDGAAGSGGGEGSANVSGHGGHGAQGAVYGGSDGYGYLAADEAGGVTSSAYNAGAGHGHGVVVGDGSYANPIDLTTSVGPSVTNSTLSGRVQKAKNGLKSRKAILDQDIFVSRKEFLKNRLEPKLDRVESYDLTDNVNGNEIEDHGIKAEEETQEPVMNAKALITPAMLANLDAKFPDLKAVAANTIINLTTLPNETKIQILSYLSPIDACATGLAHPKLYAVFEQFWKTGMPLSTRQGFGGMGGVQDDGKGYLEQGSVMGRFGVNRGAGGSTLESVWEVVGKHDCTSCGSGRCSLWRHVQGFFPGMEYCRVRGRFGEKGGEREVCEGSGMVCKKHPKST